MRTGQDFATYVAARSATVVRCLVLTGVPAAEAERVAAEALADVRGEWAELVRGGDIEVAVLGTALAADARRRRRRGETVVAAGRAAVVLRHAAGLEPAQVAAVLQVPAHEVRRALADAALVAEVVETAEQLPPVPLGHARVLAVVRRERRRRSLLSAGVAGAVAAVVAVLAVATRPDPPPGPGDALPEVVARSATNPASVVWWADGSLHLPGAVVEVGAVERLVAAGSGAAYVDEHGDLIAVTASGRRTLLGRPEPRTAVVSSPRLGLVAWTDATVPSEPRLVVWDLPAGRRVAGVVTSPRTRAIGFDGGWLTYGTGLIDWAWDPQGGPARQTGDGYSDDPADRTALVDVVAGTRLEQSGYALRVVRVGSPHAALVPGFGGELSPDGRRVVTGAQGGREPELFVARTGAMIPPPFPPELRVLAATFTADGRVAWLVDRAGAGQQILTCSDDLCTVEADLHADRAPLLAQDSIR